MNELKFKHIRINTQVKLPCLNAKHWLMRYSKLCRSRWVSLGAYLQAVAFALGKGQACVQVLSALYLQRGRIARTYHAADHQFRFKLSATKQSTALANTRISIRVLVAFLIIELYLIVFQLFLIV
jgi:hypothetical protein